MISRCLYIGIYGPGIIWGPMTLHGAEDGQTMAQGRDVVGSGEILGG